MRSQSLSSSRYLCYFCPPVPVPCVGTSTSLGSCRVTAPCEPPQPAAERGRATPKQLRLHTGRSRRRWLESSHCCSRCLFPCQTLQPCQSRCSAELRYFWLHLETCTFSSGNDAKRDRSGMSASPSSSHPRGGCWQMRQNGQGSGGTACLEAKRCGSSCSRAVSSARLLRGCLSLLCGQREPEIRACPGTKSLGSALRTGSSARGGKGLWQGWEAPSLSAFFPQDKLPGEDQCR